MGGPGAGPGPGHQCWRTKVYYFCRTNNNPDPSDLQVANRMNKTVSMTGEEAHDFEQATKLDTNPTMTKLTKRSNKALKQLERYLDLYLGLRIALRAERQKPEHQQDKELADAFADRVCAVGKEHGKFFVRHTAKMDALEKKLSPVGLRMHLELRRVGMPDLFVEVERYRMKHGLRGWICGWFER